ncbi:DUF2268 domain-containing putative Zn-dependent protease [Mucilaginibacter sp. SMC90]|uniref:gliding motility protein GldB-related protein n=1 Tax=Mucilaginibacter sp. SMC90 TaxID=2929803 RepID=UPI001FB2E4B2|nr:DUF2268 domain-containing putative Zn-dependent protease [Mucilaginibacter sp. SMC90]UOE47664.1 DUF2268 domain-containing putative Zn-dependent protease [Mucilaginibacter sp. SMC90]
MHKYLTFLFILLSAAAFGQKSLSNKGDSLYEAKNFVQAGNCYLQSAKQAEFKAAATNDYYNAACCYALSGKADSAMTILKLAINSGYKNAAHLVTDSDLNSLHQMPEWRPLLNSVEKEPKGFTDDPLKAKLVTSDIKNFWIAYDRAQKDTANRLKIYRQYYIDPGSAGLQDYFAIKVISMKRFVKAHDKKPRFYAAIRKNTYTVDKQKPQMTASFVKLKELYPQAKFPDVYFVIGAFTSGGTSTDNGLLIGLDQAVSTPDIPVDELSLWEKNNFGKLDYIPNLVAHELIHFNQGGMLGGDTTLLRAVLEEGMADFIGELISGHTANERLHVWAKGREKQIWADFEKEIYLKRGYNWIANSNQETANKPADLGYWVGYQICKGYYDNSSDKKQAIYDMLNIKDYKAFYQKSGASKKFTN